MRCILSLVALSCLLVLPQAKADDVPGCFMQIPRDAHTIGFGVYTGGEKSPVSVSTSTKTKQVTVTIPKGEHSNFIILSAYEPVYWNLAIEDGAEISGIIVLGYHSQAVGNVPPFVPVGFSTRDDGRGNDCPEPMDVYGKGADYSRLETLISDEFGKQIDEFYGDYGADCLPKGSCKAVSPSAESGFWSSLFGSSPPASRPTIKGEIRSSSPIFTGG